MDFLGIGSLELLAIMLVAFLVLGPMRMTEMARSLGKFIQEVRRTTGEIPAMLELEEEEAAKRSSEAERAGTTPQTGGTSTERRRDVD
ncbi:MAG: twin-arginine translocase TatA/TatE family subunit [Chloroflexota bacterium]|nr:twin-arginine translocase TatA/TatE family subunit [Chloroflexota bacterium]MDE2941139.1 twin-arginine translocase TatA/TatE family subunit [Chloroflexota bacterium]MDE3267335.1 twin-arginine translocase TatA/TatE family subunit [Chloroflexota bacterium]